MQTRQCFLPSCDRVKTSEDGRSKAWRGGLAEGARTPESQAATLRSARPADTLTSLL